MKTSVVVAAVSAVLLGNVTAYPQLAEKLDKRQGDRGLFVAPQAGDARTACPGCNTLANHGYINRSGRGITAQELQQGFLDAFGFDFAITAAGAQNAVNLQNNGQGTFDLDTMNQPHQIEHDGSLLRNDLEMEWNQNADNHDFNATVWCQTQQLYGGGTHVDPVAANTARLGRVQQAQQEDFPGWFRQNDGGSLAEAGFYLTAMAEPAGSNSARLDWLNFWFTNEQLPTSLGWTPRAISNDEFNAAVAAVSGAATTVPPAGAAKCAAPSTSSSPSSSTPASSSVATTSSPAPYSPTYTATSVTSYPSAPAYANSSTPQTPGSPLSPQTPTSLSFSSAPTPYTVTPTADLATPTPGKQSGAETTPVVVVSPAPGATSTTSPEAAKSLTSSAEAQATHMAGAGPVQPNAYTTVLNKEEWNQVTVMITSYVTAIQKIVISLCNLQSISWTTMPGSAGSAGDAPWKNGGGMPSPSPYNPGSGSSGSSGSSGTGSGSNPLNPAATCACK